MSDVTPGTQTSEWKTWVIAICGSLALALGSFLTMGLIPDADGFGLFEALVMVATVLAAVGGVALPTMKYNAGRTDLKVAAMQLEQTKVQAEALKAAPPVNPTPVPPSKSLPGI